MEKIAAVVILYNPDQEATYQNIATYSGQLNKLYLIDNSAVPSALLKEKVEGLVDVEYIHDGDNKGIAARLNGAAKLAIGDGFKWLLTMDQDSSFEPGGFAHYLNLFEAHPKNDVAQFAVNYLPSLFPVSDAAVQVLSTITSGTLVNLKLYELIGPYSEDLFIDLVDAEYSYRANALHYKVIQFRNIILVHSIGYIQYGRSLKTFKLTPRVLHSPIRMYYIVRNSYYMLNRFPNLPEEGRKEIGRCLSLLKNNLLYNKERFAVVRNVIRGYIDFRKNRMGKYAH